MSWSLSRAAIATGYGKETFMPRRAAIHPELLMMPPYAQRVRSSTTKGGKLIKGSAAAKKRMAYLRSLRGKGSYNNAALMGYGVEDELKKEFDKNKDLYTDILGALGKEGIAALNRLAIKAGESVISILMDDTKLHKYLRKLYPRRIVQWFKRKFHIGEPTEEERIRDASEILRRYRRSRRETIDDDDSINPADYDDDPDESVPASSGRAYTML